MVKNSPRLTRSCYIQSSKSLKTGWALFAKVQRFSSLQLSGTCSEVWEERASSLKTTWKQHLFENSNKTKEETQKLKKSQAKNLLKDVRHLQILAWNIATLHRTSPQVAENFQGFLQAFFLWRPGCQWDHSLRALLESCEDGPPCKGRVGVLQNVVSTCRLLGYIHRNPNNYPISKYRLGNIKLHVHI